MEPDGRGFWKTNQRPSGGLDRRVSVVETKTRCILETLNFQRIQLSMTQQSAVEKESTPLVWGRTWDFASKG